MIRVTEKPFHRVAFRASQANQDENQNPISAKGERATLLKAAVIAGFGVGAKALWYIFEDTSILEETFEYSGKIIDKNRKDAKGLNKGLFHMGAWAALLVGFVAAVAAVYTLYKTPSIAYQGKVNTFVKSKDMDVYVKSNDVEKELYNQMNDKAKDASEEEKIILKEQYLKLKAAKNQVPDSIVSLKS